MKLLAILCHNTNGNVADLTGFRALWQWSFADRH